jgi:glycosyltransferase involved in cell wall biosynthesis
VPSNSRIYYVAGDSNAPSGGEKHVYQHVDVLNASGFDAHVLHNRSEGRHTWFANNTSVVDYQSFWRMYDMRQDYIVLPEPFGDGILSFPGRKVIFNKNLYYGFKAFGRRQRGRYPYVHDSVAAVFAVSDHNLAHLRFAFPQARIFRMYSHIDATVFRFRPPREKSKRIACVAKADEPFMVLFHMLLARSRAGLNRLGEYEWVFLEGMSEEEVARVLEASLLLVSLSTHEGLPRGVLEALACGCLVFGYGSGPLLECLPEKSRFQPDDLLGMAQAIESITNGFPAGAATLTEWSEAGRAIALTFTKERQRRHLVDAWREILECEQTDCGDAGDAHGEPPPGRSVPDTRVDEFR